MRCWRDNLSRQVCSTNAYRFVLAQNTLRHYAQWRMAHILLTTFGSYGDLYPYLAVGRELRQRGHHIVVATSEGYRAMVKNEELAFHPVRPDVSLDDRAMLRQFFDARRGSERVIRSICSVVRESYEDTLPAAEGADLVVTHIITFAAVAVAEKLRKPWISTVLAPLSFFSAEDPGVPPVAHWLFRQLRAMGPKVMRQVNRVARAQSLPWLQPLLELRQELGLSVDEHPLFAGSHSPDRVLALFSRHLAAPAPDWPKQTVVTGFPFYEQRQPTPVPPPLQRFLSGDAPLVFTLGSSAVGAAGSFYRESLAAVQRLRARAVFLTGSHPQDLPDRLPSNVLVVPYAPHEQVFPHASVIVHQGGIGTTAQALRSGKPMLVVPFAHDQFDNSDRVRRLGAGEVLFSKRYTAARAEQQLRRLLIEPSYAQAGTRVGEQVRGENGTAAAADAIEAYWEKRK